MHREDTGESDKNKMLGIYERDPWYFFRVSFTNYGEIFIPTTPFCRYWKKVNRKVQKYCLKFGDVETTREYA